MAGIGQGDAAGNARLNVVLIVAEDLHRDALGTYGNKQVATPQLSALAENGVLFRRAYATAPSCSPSRSSILTGLYPHQNGHLGLADAANWTYALRPEIQSLPEILGRAGYRTGATYKVHVNPDRALRRSFDEFYGWGQCAAIDVRRLGSLLAAFIGRADEENKPFFWMHNLYDTHRNQKGHYLTPDQHSRYGVPEVLLTARDVQVPPHMGDDFKAPGIREHVAEFYNAVLRVDAAVGFVRKALARVNHLHDTVIIFTSDHGPAFMRGKLTLYEMGVHVPLIVSWPGGLRGATSDQLVSAGVDVFETVLDATGASTDAQNANAFEKKDSNPASGNSGDSRAAVFDRFGRPDRKLNYLGASLRPLVFPQPSAESDLANEETAESESAAESNSAINDVTRVRARRPLRLPCPNFHELHAPLLEPFLGPRSSLDTDAVHNNSSSQLLIKRDSRMQDRQNRLDDEDIDGNANEHKYHGLFQPFARGSCIRPAVFTEFFGHGPCCDPSFAVVVGRYKFILSPYSGKGGSCHLAASIDGFGNYSSRLGRQQSPRAFSLRQQLYRRARFELYDLERDPFEFNNLAFESDYNDMVAAGQRLITTWLRLSGPISLRHLSEDMFQMLGSSVLCGRIPFSEPKTSKKPNFTAPE